MTKDTIAAHEGCYERIQTPNLYKNTILDLRSKSVLHGFVEWALKRKIEQAFGIKFSIQQEKYGVSNGRIDMALYHTPRTIIHFELIATCRNGHVFRDTTSLLASRADERLAILIDEDLEADVAKNFFKAIPDGQVRFVFLREVLLDANQAKFRAIVEDLIGSAEFKNGSTDPERFYGSFPGSEIEIFQNMQVEFHNAPVNETLTIQLQQHESRFKPEHLISVKISRPDEMVNIAIPYVYNAPGESYYLAAYLSTGERWRKSVYIRRTVEAPSVFVTSGKYSPLSAVSFSVKNFPARAKLRVTIFQGNHGQGCNHDYEAVTNESGCAEGIFIIPHFIGIERVESGEHGLVVSTEKSPFPARAETLVSILAAEATQQTWRPIAIMTNNHFCSAAMRGLGFRRDEIEIEYELINLRPEPLTFMSISLLARGKDRQFLYLFVGGFSEPALLNPGQPLMRKGRFIRLAPPGEVLVEPTSLLEVSWTLALGAFPEELGQMFSLMIAHALWESEAEALLGKI